MLMPPPWAWGMRLLSCERDVPLARLTPSRLRLVPATPQLSYVRAFSPGKLTPRDWQLAPAKSQLYCIRVPSPAKPKLRGWQLGPAMPQLFSCAFLVGEADAS